MVPAGISRRPPGPTRTPRRGAVREGARSVEADLGALELLEAAAWWRPRARHRRLSRASPCARRAFGLCDDRPTSTGSCPWRLARRPCGGGSASRGGVLVELAKDAAHAHIVEARADPRRAASLWKEPRLDAENGRRTETLARGPRMESGRARHPRWRHGIHHLPGRAGASKAAVSAPRGTSPAALAGGPRIHFSHAHGAGLSDKPRVFSLLRTKIPLIRVLRRPAGARSGWRPRPAGLREQRSPLEAPSS